jgi:hypothetical protein
MKCHCEAEWAHNCPGPKADHHNGSSRPALISHQHENAQCKICLHWFAHFCPKVDNRTFKRSLLETSTKPMRDPYLRVSNSTFDSCNVNRNSKVACSGCYQNGWQKDDIFFSQLMEMPIPKKKLGDSLALSIVDGVIVASSKMSPTQLAKKKAEMEEQFPSVPSTVIRLPGCTNPLVTECNGITTCQAPLFLSTTVYLAIIPIDGAFYIVFHRNHSERIGVIREGKSIDGAQFEKVSSFMRLLLLPKDAISIFSKSQGTSIQFSIETRYADDTVIV